MPRILAGILIGLAALAGGLVLAAALTVLVADVLYDLRKPPRTPVGLPQTSSVYLWMSDGARIAADLTLPPALEAGDRIPTLIKATPYWRGYELGWLGKAMAELHLMPPLGEPDVRALARHGYAVLTVDTRGTGASFGHGEIAFEDREIADYGEIIDWLARQPWSSGAVGAYGFSYRGVLADRMAALGDPHLKAIAPSFDFPDAYLIVHPGGVFNRYFAHAWGAQTALLNQGKVPCDGIVCHWIVAGPERVAADYDGALLRAALVQHRADYAVEPCAAAAPARDDRICRSGQSLTDVSPIAHRAELERGGVPLYVLVGWFDEVSPLEAVDRFRRLANPQTLVLAPLSHGGLMGIDPYRGPRAPPDPSLDSQVARLAAFFDAHLKAQAPARAKSVTWYVLGAGAWRSAPSWPPPGSTLQAWRLAPGHALAPSAPARSTQERYAVDFTASSGLLARYRSPVDLSRTAYPDRITQDRKLAVFDSAPLSAPLEIAGDPVAHLTLATDRSDGEVIVYLEDVAPSGAVTYLTEGVLRLAFRAPATPAEAEVSADPLHGYAAADLRPMVPGRAEPVAIAFSPIAARLAAGHLLRLALAGADAGNLERIPAAGPETFTIIEGGPSGSSIDLPVLAGP